MFRRYTQAESVSLVPTSLGRTAKVRQVNGYKLNPNMIYTRVRAISARVNQNFDGFPSKELKKAYQSFIGRPVFVNHNNEDHTRTRGIILDAAYKESGNDKYIELFIEVDAKNFPKLASRIASGELDSVSMGTDVKYTKCSYCGNKAEDISDFCDHIRYQKGQTLSKTVNGKKQKTLVYESCHGLNFFEISYVFDPADETAIASKVYLPSGLKVGSLKKRSVDEVKSPEPVDTLRDQLACPICGDPGYNGKHCNYCDFVQPPRKYEDPDTDLSNVLQIVRKDPNNPINGKEGRKVPQNRMTAAVNAKRLEEANAMLTAMQRRLADDGNFTAEELRNDPDETDPTKLDQEWTSEEEVRNKPDETTDVTKLPDSYKSSNKAIAAARRAYLQSKRAAFGDPDDPSQTPDDTQAAAAPNSDGPASGPPTDSIPGGAAPADPTGAGAGAPGGDSSIANLPIDWKKDESGQPYGTVQGTDLDIFVNEDMSWQILPEGSTQPIAEGQGQSYEDCVNQAFQQAEGLSQQAGQNQGDPAAAAQGAQALAPQDGQADASGGTPPGGDPNDPTQKSSRRRKADVEYPADIADKRNVNVEDLDDYDSGTEESQYNRSDYDNNSQADKAKPVDGSDVQNFAPGGKPFSSDNKTALRKASATQIFKLIDAYEANGMLDGTRAAKTAALTKFEKYTAARADFELDTLNSVLAARGAIKPKTASAPANRGFVIPQKKAAKLPGSSRTAGLGSSTSDEDRDLLAIATL